MCITHSHVTHHKRGITMIDADRIQHIINVARLMKDNATNLGLDTKEMYTLGLLHDIGYEFGSSEEHHTIGSEMMHTQGYKYYKEILYHGMPTQEYSSTALDLLNYADMRVDKKGNVVTFEERLQDIANRRGVDSPHYKNCKVVIDHLKAKYVITQNEIHKR